MKYKYMVVECSVSSWQEVMDSDDEDVETQHLNKWGEQGWELTCVVPRLENGTTMSFGLVFKKPNTTEGRRV